ncbi:MAG: hypothetical protein LAO79_21570 [Acidobacteriia bacterium]|nr:hypothetical protein [Terriglobia bacterium]
MRRLIALSGVMLVLALAPVACKKKKAKLGGVEDESGVASVVNVADARTAAQLTRGFHNVEADAWRWTQKNFSVALRPPKGSDQQGATLQMSFSIPETISNRLGAITLSARVNGVDVGSQTYDKSGDAVFRKEVPANALGAEVVAVDFSLDKALPPTDQDSRELGIVVTTIGLIPK